MPPRTANKKSTPKKSSPKKKSKPKPKKKVPFKIPQDVQDKCMDWLTDQKRTGEKETPSFELLPSDDEKNEEENPAEFDMPFRQLARNSTKKNKDQIKMMLECEWLKCRGEFPDIVPYFKHMEVHIKDIQAQQEEFSRFF